VADFARQAPRAVIFGLSGPSLRERERAFFRAADPLGFILFARNCVAPAQLRDLIRALKECVRREDAPILIDQEGGPVQRLKPPDWRTAPAGSRFAALAARDEDDAIEAAWLNARLLAHELAALGIGVNCTPVLDVPVAGADRVIGDRAYGTTPEQVALLGRAVCAGLLAGGVLPVIKHIPGHGRARVDSHVRLPLVEDGRESLERSDFAPFRALNAMPWAMTAHVVYAAIDADAPATTSPRVVAEIIRGWIGFDGLLISDDLCMGALSGPAGERAAAALAAGLDVVLHCNGDLDEMEAVAAVCPRLSEEAVRRLARGEEMRIAGRSDFDPAAAGLRLDSLLERIEI
jgi:beta-N-acetylhexosaminidase